MFENINAVAFQKEVEANSEAVLIDVRTADEFESGHLPNAINLNVTSHDFMERVEQLDKSKTYLVYCRSGARSFNACNLMYNAGIENVTNLQGGIIAWQGEVVV